jgi:hypothetical protein
VTKLAAPLRIGLFTGLACVACGGAEPRRSGPPGGGVDPSTIAPHELSMDAAARDQQANANQGGPPPSSPPPGSPAGAGPGAGAGLDDLVPKVDGTSRGGGDPGAAASGSFKITAEHCKEMGRKFRQLAADGGGSPAQADKVGQEIAAKCTQDQLGTQVTRKEYDCILAAKAMLDVAACK